MKTLLTLLLVLLLTWRVVAWCNHLWMFDHPKVTIDCTDRGHPVSVDGVYVGCTRDEPGKPWIPEKGIPPMRPMDIPNDDWMDAP